MEKYEQQSWLDAMRQGREHIKENPRKDGDDNWESCHKTTIGKKITTITAQHEAFHGAFEIVRTARVGIPVHDG